MVPKSHTVPTMRRAKKIVISKYHQRIRQILKNQLSEKKKIRAINIYALPVIKYTAGIIQWTTEDVEATDAKIRIP